MSHFVRVGPEVSEALQVSPWILTESRCGLTALVLLAYRDQAVTQLVTQDQRSIQRRRGDDPAHVHSACTSCTSLETTHVMVRT
jgi:hypothetical protein